MIKPFEEAVATIARLPEAEQEIAADLLQQFAARNAEPYALDQSERDAVRQGLEEAERGEFASDDEVSAILRRPWY